MNRIARDRLPMLLAPAIVCAAYFLGAKIGFALKLHPYPISTLWPPNSILLAALLLAPTRSWWVLLLAALPAHVAIQLANGVPVPMLVGWFVSNCSEALIGAALVRRLTSGPFRLDSSRQVGVFVLSCTLGVTLSGFLDAGFVTLVGWGEGAYWGLWTSRFFSNLLAELTLVPMIVAWARIDREALRRLTPRRIAELGVLMIGLLAVSVPVFNWQKTGPESIAALLYAPLPLLVWAAVRFGARGASTATLTVALVAIWGAMHRLGPFVGSVPRDNAMSHIGTIFHERLPDGSLPTRTQMKFSPNTGYAFAVADDTWHSADTVGPEVTTRDSILLTYFVDAGPLRFLRNRAKRIGNFLGNEIRYLARPLSRPGRK
jgi:integral membrane sensor domain MASE1